MDAVEKAIRSALEKGDAGERAFREKVYRAAFSALERFLHSHPDLPTEEVRRRRENLKASITEIESEFVPAVAPERADAPPEQVSWPPESASANGRMNGAASAHEPSALPPRPAVEEYRFGPEAGAGGRMSTAVQDIDSLVADEREPWQHVEEPRRQSRLPRLLLGLVVLAGILAAAWWGIGAGIGLFDRPSPGSSTAVREPAQEETAARPSAADESAGLAPRRDDWMTVFSPSNATAIGVPPSATAEIMEGEDTKFVRIASPAADVAVSFDIGQGALERLAGGRAILSIVAQAVEGEETQVSVSCDFGALGDCGRKRYVVGDTRAEHLLEVELAEGPLPSSGTVSIVPDISGGGRALEVFEIRASRATD